MPTTDLHINSNILEINKGLDEAVKSTDKLEQNVKDYGQASTKAMNDSQQATSKLSSTFKLLGGVMAGAFSVTAIIAFGKAIVNSTGKGADAIEELKTGLNEMGTSFKRAIAAGDFSGIISGLKNAYAEGKLFAQVLDEIKQRQSALGVFRETIETQIAEQRIIMMNAKLSIEVRQDAINKIIELEKVKRDETLAVAQTELDAYLRISAVQIDASNKEEESIKRRKQLIIDLATAYETSEGTEKLNKDLEEASKLEERLNKLIIYSNDDRGRRVVITRAYDKAVSELSDSEKYLLDLLKVQQTIGDEELIKINQLRGTRQRAFTEQLEGEATVARRQSALYSEMNGLENKKAKEDKERTKNTVDENLASLDKYIEEANKKIFDIELGFGGVQSAEQFQKQIDENLKDFEFTMDLNPQFSTDSSFEAQAWDDAYKLMEDNLAEFERLQQEAWQAMQDFADAHPLAEAMGFESEEQLEQVKDYVGKLVEFANELIDQQVEATQRIIDDQNQRIDEQEELVNREFQLKEDGLANNYRIEQENLKKMQLARDQAIKDREKSIRIQRTMSTIESGIALVTAAANIMKGFSGIPIVGVILGLAAVAAMIAGFVAAQSSVKEVTQFKQGGRLNGPSHAEGGMRIQGTNYEVEGKEWFVNAQSSEKYNDLLTAINKDDQKALQIAVNKHNLLKAFPVNVGTNIDDSKKLGEIVKLMKSGDGVFMGNGFYIEQKGTMRKTIRLN